MRKLKTKKEILDKIESLEKELREYDHKDLFRPDVRHERSLIAWQIKTLCWTVGEEFEDWLKVGG